MMRRPSFSGVPRLAAYAAATFSVVAIAVGEEAAPSVFESITREVQGVFEKCRKAVVRIEGCDAHGDLAGTGFFIDPNGTIYTSYTIGGESRELVVSHGAMKYPARRLVCDPRSGIAILKVEAQTPFLTIGTTRNVAVASPVVAIGYPMDLPITPTFGTVGGFDIKYLGRYFATTHLRANLAAHRGEGGAPLLNLQGEVIGILIASVDQGAAFALPIEAAEKVRRDWLRFGKVRPGWIGVEVGKANAASEESNTEVLNLAADGPAAKSGIAKGDLLLQVGEKQIREPHDILDASFFLTAREAVPVRISREGTEINIMVEPTEHPADHREREAGFLSTLPQPHLPRLREENESLEIGR